MTVYTSVVCVLECSGRVVGEWDVRLDKLSEGSALQSAAAKWLGSHAWIHRHSLPPVQMAEDNSQPVILRTRTPSRLANSPAVKAARHLCRQPFFLFLAVGTTLLPCFLG